MKRRGDEQEAGGREVAGVGVKVDEAVADVAAGEEAGGDHVGVECAETAQEERRGEGSQAVEVGGVGVGQRRHVG